MQAITPTGCGYGPGNAGWGGQNVDDDGNDDEHADTDASSATGIDVGFDVAEFCGADSQLSSSWKVNQKQIPRLGWHLGFGYR